MASFISTVPDCAQLASFPAFTMLMGSWAVYAWSPNRVLLACLQCFGGGIILGAIGSELLPHLGAIRGGLSGTLAITAGFFLGFILMFFVKGLCHRADEGHYHPQHRETRTHSKSSSMELPASESAPLLMSGRSKEDLGRSFNMSILNRACLELEELRASDSYRTTLPYGLIMAVAVDSFMDGFFLGMSYMAAPRAGMILAVATAIEMCFLGLTFSASMVNCGLNMRTGSIVAAMPCILIIGSLAGGLLGHLASSSPLCFAAFLSFGVAALIFLVTQELLLEANERQAEENVPFINACFFIGFWAILMIERMV